MQILTGHSDIKISKLSPSGPRHLLYNVTWHHKRPCHLIRSNGHNRVHGWDRRTDRPHYCHICCNSRGLLPWERYIKQSSTYGGDTQSRNLYKSTCTRNFTVWHGFLYKIFLVQVSGTEYSTALYPYKKLAYTWLEWWALIGQLPIAAMFSFVLC